MTDHQLRRAVPRQPADWFGFYRFEDLVNEPLRCCRVLDISPLGAGFEVFGIDPKEPLEGRITVSIELRGEVRNTRMSGEHTARVGVEFHEPTEAIKRYLRTMSGARSRW
jgi:heme oxygenase